MKVAVIGSGASGLVAIKSCIDEGLEPVCFEREDNIGGLWYFTEDDRDKGSVYRSTVINTSKEMMCYSDFPIPKEFPPFMHNSKVLEYFHLYANHFDLYKYIRFHTQVTDIRQAKDYSVTGNWELTYVRPDSPDREEQKEIYNAVMVCIGHHASPSWPRFRGMEEFSGIKMHSHSYKDFKEFEGKRILIIGKL